MRIVNRTLLRQLKTLAPSLRVQTLLAFHFPLNLAIGLTPTFSRYYRKELQMEIRYKEVK
jgi:hypothetical protein